MSAADSPSLARRRLVLQGVVQGVGFRPFVARLAHTLEVAGWVANHADGVVIEAEASPAHLAEFEARVRSDKPAPARVDQLESRPIRATGESGFRIAATLDAGACTPTLQPDSVPCAQCLAELRDPTNRRYRYPFISCAACGPRFSITRALPFDRANTSLSDFPLCPACAAEYGDPADRRFHAQTMGCAACGPQVWAQDFAGAGLRGTEVVLAEMLRVLGAGGIVGLKGIGGYQLVVDARNRAAVARLRARKQRPAKPLALMLGDLVAVARYCRCDAADAALLASAAGPIVLLQRQRSDIAAEVAFDTPLLGVMLPSSGLHVLLADAWGGPLVVTSGNRAEMPIAIDDDAARRDLAGIADLLVGHNRAVVARLDDSVAQRAAGAPQVLRRARGYVPLTLPLPLARPTLALGAQQKNTVALGLGERAVLSQHNGDLDSVAACAAFEHTVAAQQGLFLPTPARIAVDAHPDYVASRLGLRLAQQLGAQRVQVFHHHAHVHAVVAEHALALPVTGIAWDGLGLGEGQALWGGECFDLTPAGVRHCATLRPFPLPGGDAAAREPRRAALGLLYAWEGAAALERPMVEAAFSPAERGVLRQMLAKGVNCPPTSSVGRLFDAAASLLGLRQRNAFEGDAAMQLQFAAEQTPDDALPYAFGLEAGCADWRPVLAELLGDVTGGRPVAVVARRFHASLAALIVAWAQQLGRTQVVLSGGCFQNRLLLELAVAALRRAGFDVYWPQQVPANDGGLALGQLGAVRWGHFHGGA